MLSLAIWQSSHDQAQRVAEKESKCIGKCRLIETDFIGKDGDLGTKDWRHYGYGIEGEGCEYKREKRLLTKEAGINKCNNDSCRFASLSRWSCFLFFFFMAF